MYEKQVLCFRLWSPLLYWTVGVCNRRRACNCTTCSRQKRPPGTRLAELSSVVLCVVASCRTYLHHMACPQAQPLASQ